MGSPKEGKVPRGRREKIKIQDRGISPGRKEGRSDYHWYNLVSKTGSQVSGPGWRSVCLLLNFLVSAR